VRPFVLSVASLWLSFGWVIPKEQGREAHYLALEIFGRFGTTPGDVIRYALHSPVEFARAVFTVRKLAVVYQILQPFGLILPVLSPVGLFALPALGLNLITQMASVSVRNWESVPFGPVLFVATVDTIALGAVVALKARVQNRVAKRCTAYLSLVVLGLTLVCASYWLRADEYRPGPHYDAQIMAMAAIPPGVSVSVPNYMTARFADRRYIERPTGAPFNADYLVVDLYWVREQRGHVLTQRAASDYEDLWAHAQLGEVYQGRELVWRSDGLAVYRKVP
jgi:hypothetical protein